MAETINIYCDESCHLEHDHQPIMVLGAVWCPATKSREIAIRLRETKERHGVPPNYEIKWERVSPGKQQLYIDLVDYFFDDDDLHFRAYVAKKEGLRHEEYGQDHDTWYFKMYFHMLAILFDPENRYRIYLDIKDSRSASKIAKLHEVLCSNIHDFEQKVIDRVQSVRSEEVEQIQLADLLIGAVSYVHRNLQTSAAKLAVIDRIRSRSNYKLTQNTLLRAQKVNIFHWSPAERADG